MVESDWKRWCMALAEVESADRPHSWGDDGQAAGRWQMHPAWVDTYRGMLRARLGETWDSFFRRVLRRYFDAHCDMSALDAAMYYHMGHVVHEEDATWDQEYADRFVRAWARAFR